MSEHGGLWETCRATCKLQVDDLMWQHSLHSPVQLVVTLATGRFDEGVIGGVFSCFASQDEDLGPVGFVVQRSQKLSVVQPADCLRGEEHLAVGKLQAVHGLGGRVSVVQDDEDGADFGHGEEDGGVLLAVPGHDAHAVSNPDSHIQQGLCEGGALLVQFVVRPSCSGPGNDDALLSSMLVRLELEKLPKGQVDEGRLEGTMQDRKLLSSWPSLRLRLCHSWLCGHFDVTMLWYFFFLFSFLLLRMYMCVLVLYNDTWQPSLVYHGQHDAMDMRRYKR